MSDKCTESPQSSIPVTLNPAWVEACQALDYGDIGRTFMRDIIRDVARRRGITSADILSHRRLRNFVDARYEFVLLATEAGKTQGEIARFLNRDPSTVSHYRHYRSCPRFTQPGPIDAPTQAAAA